MEKTESWQTTSVMPIAANLLSSLKCPDSVISVNVVMYPTNAVIIAGPASPRKVFVKSQLEG